MLIADRYKIKACKNSFTIIEFMEIEECVNNGDGFGPIKTGKKIFKWVDHDLFISKFENALAEVLELERLKTVKPDISFAKWVEEDNVFKNTLKKAFGIYLENDLNKRIKERLDKIFKTESIEKLVKTYIKDYEL